MKIEVGKAYRTRDGKLATVEHRYVGTASSYNEFSGNIEGRICAWNEDGRWCSIGPDNWDLVEEVAPPLFSPEIAPKLRGRVDLKRYGVSPVEDVLATYRDCAERGAAAYHAQATATSQLATPADPLTAIRHDIRKLRIGGWFNSLAIVILAILAFLFSTRANATDIAAMPNAAGGEIVLTTDRGGCPDLYLLAYSRGDNGTVITGCWLPGSRYVLIKWSDSGVIKLFAYDQFTPLVRQVPAAERRL